MALEHGVDRWLSHKVSLLGGQAGRRRGDRRADGMKEERETGSRISGIDRWLF